MVCCAVCLFLFLFLHVFLVCPFWSLFCHACSVCSGSKLNVCWSMLIHVEQAFPILVFLDGPICYFHLLSGYCFYISTFPIFLFFLWSFFLSKAHIFRTFSYRRRRVFNCVSCFFHTSHVHSSLIVSYFLCLFPPHKES